MYKMKNLSTVEEEIFRFIRRSFSLSPQKLVPAFKNLKEKLQQLQGNPLESRSFMYLDFISWLESRIEGVPVQQVRKKIFLQEQHQAAAGSGPSTFQQNHREDFRGCFSRSGSLKNHRLKNCRFP